jgi:7-cyano-7-deazaguanine synthase
MKKAVVLLSGGLDSATTLAIAGREGFELYALTFDYGQRHKKEIECAKRIAKELGVREHKVFDIDLTRIGGSALTDASVDVPMNRNLGTDDIPRTYVPARNLILLSIAVAWAEVLGADAVFIGANAVDYSGYPDCRPEFFESFGETARMGTKMGAEGDQIEIKHPLVHLSKADIIRLGDELKAPFGLTWSCYLGGEKACGRCDSCVLRLKGFREAGLEDPIEYES